MPRKDSESSCSSDHSHHEENESLSNDTVVNKYQMAAEITNSVLKEVIAAVKEGVEVGTLCDLGDKLILERASKVFKKEKNVTKGIGMPTSVSVDSCICHYSPLRSEAPIALKNGQVVKIDLGAHVDGYIAVAAHTVVVGSSAENKVTGKTADLLKATYDAMEVAIRMFRPGNQNTAITECIDKVAAEYGVTPIENMLSHQLERDEIHGPKQIIQNASEKEKQEMETVTIDKHEAYTVDIIFTTGNGKPNYPDVRTTIYKKNEEIQYSLKMKASRTFYSECNSKYGPMPFSLRSFEDEVKAKLGVVECEKHGLVQPFRVLHERDGEVVAQFKSTILVMPNGIIKIAGLPFDTSIIDSSMQLKDEALVQTLNTAMKPKKKKAAKKEGAQAAATEKA